VISSDLDRVGQSAPNTKARFVEVDLDGALAARKEYKTRTGRLREALA
jgi:allophanate hydrolase subunit 2